MYVRSIATPKKLTDSFLERKKQQQGIDFRSRLHAFVAVPPSSGTINEEPRNYWSKGAAGDPLDQNEPATIYLAGQSEADTQRWMDSLRSMLARPTFTRFGKLGLT